MTPKWKDCTEKYKNTRNHNGQNSFELGVWKLQVAVLLKSNLNFSYFPA